MAIVVVVVLLVILALVACCIVLRRSRRQRDRSRSIADSWIAGEADQSPQAESFPMITLINEIAKPSLLPLRVNSGLH